MNIFYLLWWWLIPTIISAGNIKLKKQATIKTRTSHYHQPNIQAQYQHQADATGHTSYNDDNLEINPVHESELEQAPSHQTIRNVLNLESSASKKSIEQVDVTSSNLTFLESSPGIQSDVLVEVESKNVPKLESRFGNQNEPMVITQNATKFETSLSYQEGPQVGSSDVTNLEIPPDKQTKARQVVTSDVPNLEINPANQTRPQVVLNDNTNLNSNHGKQSGPQVASSNINNSASSYAKESALQFEVDSKNVTNLESSLQNEPMVITQNATKFETSLSYQDGPQVGSSDVTNFETSPDELTKSRKIVTSDIPNLEINPVKQTEPQVAFKDVANLESSPGKSTDSQVEVESGDLTNAQNNPEKQINSRQVASIDLTNLESQPGHQSVPQMASSDVTNFEISGGKQVAAGGFALSPNIGENVAPAYERPSKTQVIEGAPAPVAQPAPPPPTLQPSGDDEKNKTKNGTINSTNSTTIVQDIDGYMKQGAKGKSFQDTVQHQDLKNIQNAMIDLGGDANDFSCNGNRGHLRQLYSRSKYFVDSVNRYTYEEGRTECNRRELVFAEIDSMADFKSIQIFFDFEYKRSRFNPTEDRYFIGLNDLEDEGVYVRADGSKIQFQAYFTTQPDDKDGKEDCNAIGKDDFDQPIGMMDVSCFNKYHLLCMFPPEDTCINETREASQYYTLMKHFGVHALMDLSDRSYSVSNFQLPWEQAFDFCLNQSMHMFDMDHMVTTQFFRTLYQHEEKTIANKTPVIQWWTSGRFKDSHMNAAVYWENKESVHNEVLDEHRKTKQNFTFSGVFRWNNLKGADPTGRLGKRKDICLSFGFQLKPEDTPFVRNTNCGLPCYFICSKDHATKIEEPENTDEMR